MRQNTEMSLNRLRGMDKVFIIFSTMFNLSSMKTVYLVSVEGSLILFKLETDLFFCSFMWEM